MPPHRRLPAAVLVFFATFAFLYWANGHRFVLIHDEGIYLEGARRLLAGDVPYRDFFVITGPGSYWLHAAAIKLLGPSLSASRMVTLFDIAGVTTCVFWLVASRARAALAAIAAFACVVMETADPLAALPNHRWDSGFFASLGITLIASEASPAGLVVAGAALAFSAWITPTFGLVSIALGVYLLCTHRTCLKSVGLGWFGCCAVATALMSLQGSFLPMIRQMVWLGSNYRESNYMPYGSVVGGYEHLFSGTQGAEFAIALLIACGIALPAILPILSLPVAWTQRTTTWAPLALGAFSMVLTAHPRYDVQHLIYTAPLFYALAAFGASRIQIPALRTGTFIASALLLATFSVYQVARHLGETEWTSRMGTLRGSTEDAQFLHTLEEQIPQGSELFVFPYLPMAYFATRTLNPTRFVYMQPGLMTSDDEQTAIAELRAHPPQHILSFDLTEEQVLTLWPSTDRKRLHLQAVEDYLAGHYQLVRDIPYQKGVFHLLVPKPVYASGPAPTATP